MAKKLRYRLHWASGDAPMPSLKWVIYDWKPKICPVAYLESRVTGRKVCALLNADSQQLNKRDEIISKLMDALELISREADKAEASRHYISGVALQAMSNCNAQRERNSDGYLVVRTEAR